jgi:transcriptional regulator with XRE-family HTH domain
MKYDTEILKTVGNNIRALRKGQGLSQEALASKASLHRTYIGSIERGKRNVSLLNLQRLARALGVPVTALV